MTKPYDVGYGKPPKDTQFKSGSSGNPNGRPKKPNNLVEALKKLFSEKIVIRENSRLATINRYDALVKSLYANAVKGHRWAWEILLELMAIGGMVGKRGRCNGEKFPEPEVVIYLPQKKKIER